MIFKRLLNHLKPYKKSLIIVSIVVLLSSILSLFAPLLLGKIITSLYTSVSTNSSINIKYIYTQLIIIAILYLLTSISSYIENYLMSNISENITNNLKNEINKKFSKLNMKYYDTHSVGELTYLINNDTEAISSLLLQSLPKIINYSVSFVGIIIIMFTINIPLSLIVLITIPLTILITKIIIKLSKKKYIEYHNKYSYLTSLIQESYSNIEIISLYNNKEKMSLAFNTLNKDLAKTNIKATLLTSLTSPFISLINYLIYLLIIVLGSHYVLINKMLLGDIQSFIQYTKQISNPITNFSSLINSIQSGLVSANRIFSILDEKEEIIQGKEELKSIESIEFKNVSFSYNDSPLLQNITFKINKGEKIAIVGETGSGKSTIVNLLMRFYKIQKGEVFINNKSIYDYTLDSYYKNISYISQDKWLFNGTIKDNLKYGNKKINDNDLFQLSKITNSFDSINNLPNKFDEYLYEDDKRLSEGEKQLLIITRSLIKNCDLLILDEATSNVDPTTEKLIQEATKKITKNKTTITIAHKLSTILKADKIIVIKNGMISEIKNHTTSSKEKGEYYKFIQTL